jgi:Xaa-Pro aminopeptidase
MLLNLDRAREIMDRLGFDGLVAQLPVNVYYLSDYWGLLMNAQRFDAAYFAILPRAESAPATLVLPSFELRRLVSEGGTWMPGIIGFTSVDEEAPSATGHGKPYLGWPVRDGSELGDRERAWLELTAQQRDRVAPDAITAMIRALDAAGLTDGRLATDDPRLGEWLSAQGYVATVRCDPNVFNEIRLVKTETELALMRRAAEINERSLRAAATAAREGAEWPDIERVYFMSMAAQDGRGSYFICGAGGLPSGRVRRGEPMMLDALGTYRQYHGDFGRCVIVGEPGPELERRHGALCAGWQAVLERLRPGATYRELAQTAVETVRKAGFPEFVYATPHALGLEHTDDPKPPGAQPGAQADTVLEANMVLNVDMPYTEIGWGSVHIEDTVRITTTGFETLTTQDLSIIRI